jgi:hypothetical protein
MLAILIGVLAVALMIWLVPAWALPWLFAASLMVYAVYCVIGSGYPVVPTLAWAVPTSLIELIGAYLSQPWYSITGSIALAAFLAFVFLAPARRYWYVTLFHWRR